MALNTVIDVAIGLSLMYLLLSLLATIVNEKISSFFALRARTLKSGVTGILSGTSFADLTSHPLIGASDGNHPSYISGQAFAMAVLDKLNPDTQLSDSETYQAIVGAIAKLPPEDDKLKNMLRGVVNNTTASLTHVRDGVAAWFDHSMMRLEGDYKRLMHMVSLLVGLVIAIAFNADSFHVATTLWRDPVVRAAVADNATQALPILNDGTTPGLTAQEVQQHLTQLPIGWASAQQAAQILLPWHAGFSWTVTLLAVAGWLVTAMAVSLGAPFWFDLLGKFVNIRSSGGKPPMTQVPPPVAQTQVAQTQAAPAPPQAAAVPASQPVLEPAQ